MNLLPKSHQEFSKADYWNSFFSKRGKSSFEWYGEFPELSSYLLKYIKPKDDILIVGCGNSTLGMNLYDVGFKNIVNIDVSQVAIKQMKEMNKIKRPNLIFEQMDATKMDFADGKFSVVLDKGTLDALMPDTKSDTLTLINMYLEEIKRVLRATGRYICISLLQEHIIRKLAASFSSEYAFRIIRCHDVEMKAKEQDESSIPVFLVVCTKFINLTQPILETVLTDSSPVRLNSVDEIVNQILSTQETASLCNSLYKSSVAAEEEISLDLFRPGEENPRYTIYIMDQLLTRERKNYAVFIVPQGREMDWLFSTKEGRQQLLKSAQHDRLAIVILRREHQFESLDAVKDELSNSVKNFAPVGLSKSQIPFLSLGSDIGKRKVCYKGKSDISGSFVIEEVETDNGLYRRLVFLNNQFVVQSEAKLKEITTRRKKVKLVVDPHFLACTHHLYMSLGLKAAMNNESNADALVIGLGGGGLCMFIRQYVPQANIIAVEIDKEILKVAKEYFDLTQNDKLKVEIADGIKYLQSAAKSKRKFDAILSDVDSKDSSIGMSCPPKQFVERDFLETISTCLSDDGFFILNLVARNKSLRDEVLCDLKDVFKFVSSFKLSEDINEIIFCSKMHRDNGEWRKTVQNSAVLLNTDMRAKCKKDDFIDVSSLMNDLKLEN